MPETNNHIIKEPEFLGDNEELKKRYKELQIRITKFSAVEQQLINARNRLDYEVAMHKRMHDFNKKAFVEMSDNEFYKLVAEAIVDIFEVEVGLVVIGNADLTDESYIGVEGTSIDEKDHHQIHTFLESLYNSHKSGNVIRHNASDFELLKSVIPINQAYGIQLVDLNNNVSVIIIGAILDGGVLLYNSLDNEREVVFSVFAQQVMAQVLNRKKNQTIINQIDNIETSGKRLSRITNSFLNFGTSPTENIILLTKLVRDLLKAESVSYFNLEQGIVNCTGNSEFSAGEENKNDCNFCASIFKTLNDDTFFYYSSAEILKLKTKHNCNNKEIKAIMGCAVLLENKPVGSLAVVFNKANIANENDKQIMKIISAGIAVEERRNISMKALEESELRYRTLFDGSPHGILIAEVESRKLRYANHSICKMLGYKEDDLTSMKFKDLVPNDSFAEITSNLKTMITDHKVGTVEIPFLKKNGSVIYTDVSSYSLKLDNVELIAGFITDITDRKNATENLIENNIELQKINSELDHFVYSISHDLRAPLLAIKGLLYLIDNEESKSDDNITYLELISESVSRMDDTILEILEYSRNARLQLKEEEIDIEKMAREIFENVKYHYVDMIELQLDIDKSVKLYSDKFRISTILKNLISNSVKYKKHNGEKSFVKVKCYSSGENVFISVKDNGEGIPKKYISKIFDMFYRGTSTGTGTGMGLYICKEIVAKLGGSIHVKSKEGISTEFLITLNNKLV